MRAFDAIAARNGEAVITRDGREAKLDPLSLDIMHWQYCFIVDGVSYPYTKSGRINYDEDRPGDLFMKD